MITFDLDRAPLRELNQSLHDVAGEGDRRWRIVNPRGRHNIAVGMTQALEVEVAGTPATTAVA